MPYFPQYLNIDPEKEDNKPASLKKLASSLGLTKSSANKFVCPSTKDFWEVRGDKIVRLSSEEVDFGEILDAPKDEDPGRFLSSILDELEL